MKAKFISRIVFCNVGCASHQIKGHLWFSYTFTQLFSVTDNQTSYVEHQLFIRYCEIIGNLGGLIFADIVVTPHP